MPLESALALSPAPRRVQYIVGSLCSVYGWKCLPLTDRCKIMRVNRNNHMIFPMILYV